MLGWKKTLYILWVGQFLTSMAMTLGLSFIPFFLVEDPILNVTSAHQRLIFTSLIMGAPFVTAIVATPFWGWMADRTGRKRQVIRASFGLGLIQIAMGFVRLPEHLVILRVLQGAVSGVMAANLGLLSAAAPKEFQGRALTTLQSAQPAGIIFGPLLGGVLAAALGYRPVYWLLGGVVLSCGIVSWVLLREDGFVPSDNPNPFRSIGRALGQAWQQPGLRLAFSTLWVAQLAWSTTQVAFAIYAGNVIERWVVTTGATRMWWNTGLGFTAIAMALTGIANFAMSFVWGRAQDRGVRFLTPLGASAMGLSNLLLAVTPPFWAVILGRGGIGLGIGGAQTLQYARIAKQVPTSERGSFMGLATATTHLGSLVGFLISGSLAHFWGLTGNFYAAAALYALILAFHTYADLC